MVASKILMVDDEPDLKPLVMSRMRRDIRAGRYEFIFAEDGVEAVGILSSDKDIDIIITDINMPRMDGLTLLNEISKINPDTVTIVVSAYGDMPNIRTAMNRGAFDFVTKPINFQDFRVTISRTLSHLEEWRVAQSTKERLLAMEMELDLASRMQKSILPTAFPESRDYQNHARMEPAREVGGDFYDLIRLEDEKVGIVMADVSEKGVPAVQPMMSIRTMLKGAAISYENPGDVLTEVNSLICKENDGEKYVTVLYAVYNPSYSSLTYANGGHESPLLIHRDGVLERLPSTDGMALGITPSESFEENTILLAPGDTVICYTDGATDAEDTAGEQFGQDRLARLFEEETSYGAGGAVDMVSSGIDDFVRGATQADDITSLALYRT